MTMLDMMASPEEATALQEVGREGGPPLLLAWAGGVLLLVVLVVVMPLLLLLMVVMPRGQHGRCPRPICLWPPPASSPLIPLPPWPGPCWPSPGYLFT